VSDRPLSLVIVDEDDIFRLGLATSFLGDPHFQVVGQVKSLKLLATAWPDPRPDLLIVDPWVLESPGSGWQGVQELRRRYAGLKICLLTASLDYEKLLALQSLGIEGYFPKGTAIATLKAGLQCLHRGEIHWAPWAQLTPVTQLPPLQKWLWHLLARGLAQIETSLTTVEQKLIKPRLSPFDRLFWQGQRRELRTVRRLVKGLLPSTWPPLNSSSPPPQVNLPSLAIIPPAGGAVVGVDKAGFPLNCHNLTAIALELDILQPRQRRELLQICIQQWESLAEDWHRLNITSDPPVASGKTLWGQIWQNAALNFLTPYLTTQTDFKLVHLQSLLVSYQPVIEAESFSKIPFPYPLTEQLPGTAGSRGEWLPLADLGAVEEQQLYLHNALIRIANGVMVFVLNYFSEQETMKIHLYDQGKLSSREMARFRNNLSWHYQLSHYWLEPKAIFESHHQLLYFSPLGIQLTQVYAPRQQELAALGGLPWLVTIVLELRDALSPRLRSLIAFLGQGLVFFLTQVVGRAIGLIARGILQGIGNAWQDSSISDKGSKGNF